MKHDVAGSFGTVSCCHLPLSHSGSSTAIFKGLEHESRGKLVTHWFVALTFVQHADQQSSTVLLCTCCRLVP